MSRPDFRHNRRVKRQSKSGMRGGLLARSWPETALAVEARPVEEGSDAETDPLALLGAVELVDSLQEGVAVFDDEDRLVLCNDKYQDFFPLVEDLIVPGVKFETLIRAAALFDQNVEAETQPYDWIQQRIEAHRKPSVTFEHRFTDGRFVRAMGRRTANGYTVSTYTDITELRHRESELSGKSVLMATALENIDQGICILTPDLCIAAFNQRLLNLVSVGQEHFFIGADVRDILYANAEAGYYGSDNAAEFAMREILAMEQRQPSYRERTEPGGEILEVISRPLPDGGFVITYTDVTELRMREKELQEKSALMEVALENMAQGICILDSDLRVAAVNPRLFEILPMSREVYVLGTDIRDVIRGNFDAGLYGPEEIETTVKRRIARLENREPHHVERTYQDGRILEIVGRPLPDNGFVITYNDVTESRRSEQRVSQGQKMEALGQLAGGIAHEFNNLLTSIKGFTRLALKKPDDTERVEECLKEVSQAANRAASLTKQMLTFSHNQVLEPKVVRIGELIHSSEKLLRAFMEESIILNFEIKNGRACANVDSARLSQAIVNLAINARHAMPEGGELKIGCDVIEAEEPIIASHGDELPPGSYIRIWATDQGTGIPLDALEHIFEPFFTTKGPGKGTGLGLSLVYGMVKNLKGFIDVETTVGVGTTFTIYLPVVDAEPEIESAEKNRHETNYNGCETILVAEDDRQLRSYVKSVLEDQGYTVLVAPDGVGALEVFETNMDAVDLLVTDVVMPGMSGVELAQRVAECRPELRALYMTGYAPELNVLFGDLHEDFTVLRKPFDPEALTQLVREQLNG